MIRLLLTQNSHMGPGAVLATRKFQDVCLISFGAVFTQDYPLSEDLVMFTRSLQYCCCAEAGAVGPRESRLGMGGPSGNPVSKTSYIYFEVLYPSLPRRLRGGPSGRFLGPSLLENAPRTFFRGNQRQFLL